MPYLDNGLWVPETEKTPPARSAHLGPARLGDPPETTTVNALAREAKRLERKAQRIARKRQRLAKRK